MNGEEGSFMMNLFGTTFHDFAGSTVVHSVGGWIALVGAAILGPRIGKYGKDGRSKAIPGHNLTVAALGVFILWFGWFGFNPGSQLAASTEADAIAISHVFLTTNLAACAGGFRIGGNGLQCRQADITIFCRQAASLYRQDTGGSADAQTGGCEADCCPANACSAGYRTCLNR